MSDDFNQHSLTITINFSTLNLPQVDLNVVEKLLATSRWDEGRYPFYEEMVHIGLAKLIEYAVGDAVSQAMRKQHGDKTCVLRGDIGGPNGMASLASIKTQEAMKEFHTSISDSIKVAAIGRPVKE